MTDNQHLSLFKILRITENFKNGFFILAKPALNDSLSIIKHLIYHINKDEKYWINYKFSPFLQNIYDENNNEEKDYDT